MELPNIEERFLDDKGRVNATWQRFLRNLGPATDIADLQAAVAALQAELAAIGTPRDVIGQYSIQAIPGDGAYYLHLLGDTEEPGFTYYYGTGPDGLKGWYPVADTVEAAADELTKAVDADTGVTTFGLADVTPAAGGTLQLTTFDDKGRRSEEDDATAADLPYDNATSGLTATDVQAAIDEVAAGGGGGGSGGYLDPHTNLIDPLYDFLGKPPTITSAEPGASYPWVLTRRDGTSVLASINGGSNAPGVWQIGTGSSTNSVSFALGDVPNIVIGGGEIRLPFRFRVPTLSDATNRFVISIGLADSHGGAVNNGVRISYSDNSNAGKFVLNTTNGGTTTSVNGATTISANTWYACEIVINAAGTQADLYVGGVLECSSTTNMPTAALLLGTAVFKVAGTTVRTIDYDYIGPPQKVFTTSR